MQIWRKTAVKIAQQHSRIRVMIMIMCIGAGSFRWIGSIFRNIDTCIAKMKISITTAIISLGYLWKIRAIVNETGIMHNGMKKSFISIAV